MKFSMRHKEQSYNTAQIVLHWTIAAL
ncbi:MAG: cytochrome b561, partial [Marinomonas primoryensis]